MSCMINRSGALVGEVFDIVDFLWILRLYWILCWWCSSQEAGVSMFCEPFGDHYNGFRFVSVDFCCHLPYQAKRGKDVIQFSVPFDWKSINSQGFGVWFPRNIPINLMIYAWCKKVKCWFSKHTWNFLKSVSVKLSLNILIDHSIASLKSQQKLSVTIFCVPGMCSGDTHLFCDVHHTHSSFTISLQTVI